MGFSVPPCRLPLTRLSILLIDKISNKPRRNRGIDGYTKHRRAHEPFRIRFPPPHPEKTLPAPLAITSAGRLHLQFAQISFPYPGTRPSVHTKMYVQTQPGRQGKPDCTAISDTVKPYGAVKPCRRQNKRSARRTHPYRKQPLATHQRCGLRTLRRPNHDPSGACNPVSMRLFS